MGPSTWATTTWATPSGAPTTKLVGQGCCRPFKEILDARRDMTRTECMEVCMSRQACNAFAISGCSSSSDENCGGACHIYELDSAEEAYVQTCSETNGFLGITSSTFCFAMQCEDATCAPHKLHTAQLRWQSPRVFLSRDVVDHQHMLDLQFGYEVQAVVPVYAALHPQIP